MKVRYISNPKITGFSSELNVHSVGEVIIGFDEGDMTSEFIRELEVWLDRGQAWVPMRDAFQERRIETDNLNHWFREAAEVYTSRGNDE